MDFKGQELSEQLYQGIVFAFMLLALVIGYVRESYNLMLVVYAAGVLLAFVAAVPDWPYFNQNPVKWLPSAEKLDGKEAVGDGDKSKGKGNGGKGQGKNGATPQKKKKRSSR
eukprot:PRCOL_00005433-RA